MSIRFIVGLTRNIIYLNRTVYWLVLDKLSALFMKCVHTIFNYMGRLFYILTTCSTALFFISNKMPAQAFTPPAQPRTQALHCFYRDQWQLINAKRARVLGQHATGNCSAWQKMHQTWRTSYSKHWFEAIYVFEACSKKNCELLNC